MKRLWERVWRDCCCWLMTMPDSLGAYAYCDVSNPSSTTQWTTNKARTICMKVVCLQCFIFCFTVFVSSFLLLSFVCLFVSYHRGQTGCINGYSCRDKTLLRDRKPSRLAEMTGHINALFKAPSKVALVGEFCYCCLCLISLLVSCFILLSLFSCPGLACRPPD
jgi:hypothetical protein